MAMGDIAAEPPYSKW